MGIIKSNWKSYETVGENQSVRATLSLLEFGLEMLPNKDTYNVESKVYSSL